MKNGNGMLINITATLFSALIDVLAFCFCGCQKTLPLQKEEFAGDWQIVEAQLSDYKIISLSVPAFSLEENENVILHKHRPAIYQCPCYDNTLFKWGNVFDCQLHVVFDFLQSQGHTISGRWNLETEEKMLFIEFRIPPINEKNFPNSDLLIRRERGMSIKDSFMIKRTTRGLQIKQFLGDPDERRFLVLEKI